MPLGGCIGFVDLVFVESVEFAECLRSGKDIKGDEFGNG